MKKILTFTVACVVLLGTLLSTTACSSSSYAAEKEFLTTSNYASFHVIEEGQIDGWSGGYRYSILVDEMTEVLYFCRWAGYGGVMSPLLNADGTPKLLSDFHNN